MSARVSLTCWTSSCIPSPSRELVDLGSRNGTFVNGHAVEQAVVHELDIVTVGHHAFRLVGSGLEEYVDTGSISFEARGLRLPAADGRLLLDGVTFSLEERAFLAVAGPSGSGKSTLLGALTGLRPAAAGQVLYDGQDLYDRYDELQNRIGYVPQEDVVHTVLTVAQAMDYAAQLRFARDVDRAQRTAEIDAVLAELGIADVKDNVINRLSGGQRRRVAVAMELVTKPSLLFLDEPTSGLDPGNERALMTMLRRLADAGHTVVTVTHAMDSVRLCDRLLLLAPGGRPAYFGPPQLAPAAFACHDLQGVFELLNAQPGRDWGEVLTGGGGAIGLAQAPVSPRDAIESALAEPPRDTPGESSPVGAGVRSLSASARRHGSQFGVLVRRHVRVIVGDRRNALLPVLGDILLGMNAHISRDLPFAVARAGLREPDGQSAEADFNRVNGLLGSVTPATLAGEAQRYDPTLVTSVLAPARMYPATVQQLLAAWRSDSWQNAERLVAARTRAQRAAVAESIERGAVGRARLIAALTSNLVTGPSAAVRTAYCERRVSQDAER